MLSALVLVAPLNLHSQERQDFDMTTTVGAAISKTALAKEVEEKANIFIEKESGIKKENLGFLVAMGRIAVSKEISTYQLKNTEFSYRDIKSRLDMRYKLQEPETAVSFSVIKEF